MKKTLPFLVISILILTVQFSFGQTTSPKDVKKKSYIVWVTPISETPTFEGYLSEVGDTLVIAPRLMSQTVQSISLDNVDYLQFRRKGGTKRSMLNGTLIGIGVGGIIGALTYEECPEQDPLSNLACDLVNNRGLLIFGSAILGGVTGLAIGAIAGNIKIKVPVQGSKKSKQAQKEELLKYKFGE